MRHRLAKVTVCAVATALLLGSFGARTEAARGVAASLPAAGLGLTFEEGTSVARIREGVKQKKLALKEAEKEQEVLQRTPGEESSESQPESKESESRPEEGSIDNGDDTNRESQSGQETLPSEESGEQTESSLEESESLQDEEESESETEIVEPMEPVIREPETKTIEKKSEPELIIAQVNRYVNIRSKPGTDGEIVGKLYDNSVGTLIAEVDDWYEIKSGNVEGYVKAEYFKRGDEAKRIADEVGDKIATVTTQTLKVRKDPSLDAQVLGLVPGGEELTVLDTADGFVKVSIEEGDGWVSTDYVSVDVEYVTAESVEEERKRLAAEEAAKEEARKAAEAAEEKLRQQEKKREEKKKAEEAKKQEEARKQAEEQNQAGEENNQNQPDETKAEASIQAPSASGSLGASVANYAVQFVGNPYVYGGTSLTNGADCSGFVMSVYKEFGVSLPHSSSADRHVGYKVESMAEAQPGDIICYSGHVAIYIGDNKIVHASTKATGIKISDASYRKPLAIRRIF